MMSIFSNKYFKFAVAAVIYLLWVIWVGSFWLLAGLPVIFDIYVTKKVNWTFWKKREGKNSLIVEWIDALIFAVVAVTLINIFLFQNYRIPTGSMEKSLLIGDHLFVSKVAYGPRIPNTPLAFPFTQHTMPVTNGKSWSNLVQWPYKRLKGFREIERYDPVVFNFPEGDTVVLEDQAVSYYEIVRGYARNLRARDINAGREAGDDLYYHRLARRDVRANSSIIYRPVDRRDNYVKRCVALPGDTLLIREGVVIVNGIPEVDNGNMQTTYYVTTNGTSINRHAFERMNIYRSDQNLVAPTLYLLPLTSENAEAISRFSNVTDVSRVPTQISWSPNIFPHDQNFVWNQDHFGPLWIPARGATVDLDTVNIILYKRIIEVYESNELRVEEGNIYINGERATEYTFKMDYYWMMGDNRHQSSDSRFWGFVPEDHIIGSPRFIWLSLNKEERGFKKIRFGRFFTLAR
jgi:signal peptidase I